MARFILDKNKALEQYDLLKYHADLISYSSKTNPLISRILENQRDCLFSIHLENEVKHIQDKSRVLFLLQATSHEQLSRLIGLGIRWFAVDNEQDLEVLMSCMESCDEQINLLLRLRLKQHTLRTEKHYVFGMEAERIVKQVISLRDSKCIELLGVHFHRSTQNMSEWNLKYEIEELLSPILDKLDLVNIGGGLPSEYANTNVKVLDSIFLKIDEFKSFLNSKGVKLMIEPGRFIAAPAIRLETKILSIHGNTIIVDASVYNSDMDALIVPVKLLVDGELTSKEGKPFIIKGITPCSLDLFRYRVYLVNPKKGDTITFLNAGAYNFASEFCDLEKIETNTA